MSPVLTNLAVNKKNIIPQFDNILRHFDVLPNSPFTTNETM